MLIRIVAQLRQINLRLTVVLIRQHCRSQDATARSDLKEQRAHSRVEPKGPCLAPIWLHLRAGEVGVLKLQNLGWQRSTPFDSKLFIYNRFVISQAECRGFDPRLRSMFQQLSSSDLAPYSDYFVFCGGSEFAQACGASSTAEVRPEDMGNSLWSARPS